MYLDYSKLAFDKQGLPEQPELRLDTMAGDVIGIIPGVSGLNLEIKLAEPSEISFDVAAVIDGKPNPIYDRLEGYKLIYTKDYGIYVVMEPSEESDGVFTVKHIKGYSLEKTLESKKFFLEEGTFKFYDATDPTSPDTIVGRILEVATGWNVGYVSPTIGQKYRTFDQYDNYLLSFIYSDATELYRCIFVFDPYKKTMSVYDADAEREMLPIYLDFDNLLEEITVDEMSDELVTALSPYGADDLDIRAVNPTGSNWIYNLDHFIANGDIPSELADRWNAWQASIASNREYFKGLSALRASATAQMLAAQADLTDLNGELETLQTEQSAIVQALALDSTSEGQRKWQGELNRLFSEIQAKKNEIAAKQSEVTALRDQTDPDVPGSYAARIAAVVSELSFNRFFTEEEQARLSSFFIEQDMVEDTFVASTVDTAISGQSGAVDSGSVGIEECSVTQVDMTEEFGKTMYVLAGGHITVAGAASLTCDIIRGTLEAASGGKFVLSIYAGTITSGDMSSPSGTITLTGNMFALTSNIAPVVTDGITDYIGSRMSFNVSGGTLYITANVSDYQKYSVQEELYDYASCVLKEASTPVYEFKVDSGNFIFAKEFEPFRDRLELGRCVYLNLGDGRHIKPAIIEFSLNFEDSSDFSVVFSNRFQRFDAVGTLKDIVEQGYSTSRSFEASKYLYNQTVGQASAVSRFMNDSLDAAKNAILAAANQTVRIDGAGIHIGGDSNYQMRIVDNMLAMTDDNWEHAKLAIGRFASPTIGEYWGVNAEVIGGKLMVTNNLIIENPKVDENNEPTGIMQFKVDSTGAWLYNSTFVLESDTVAAMSLEDGIAPLAAGGGKIILDPKYGIVGGTGNLFTVDGTSVVPSFIDASGRITVDEQGMPENANFFLDIRDGKAYFRGNVYAQDGVFNGTVYANDGIFNGTVYATDGEFTGTIHARDGEFSGTLSAPKLKGRLEADPNEDGWLIGCGIDIGNGKFYVDKDGNLTLAGNINMEAGNITWGSNTPVKYRYSVDGSSWHDTMTDADMYRQDSLDGGKTWGSTYQFRGKNGTNGQNGSDASVTRANIVRAMLNNNPNDGLYTTNIGGVQCLGINATAIKAGVIDGIDIYGTNVYGGTFWNTGQNCCLYMTENGSNGMYDYGNFRLYEATPSTFRPDNYGYQPPYFSLVSSDQTSAGQYGAGVALWAWGHPVLELCEGTGGHYGAATPWGTWDFSGATVVNFTPKFS